jgi:hypothetical protein
MVKQPKKHKNPLEREEIPQKNAPPANNFKGTLRPQYNSTTRI